jgi:hypothetical protein
MSTAWFYIIDEREHGPIESKTLKLLAEVGQITPNTLVRKATSKNWAEAHQVKQLFTAHNSPPQNIDAPPIIGQPSDSEGEKTVAVQPPIIPTAELAVPESDAFTAQINIVTPPTRNGAAEDHSPSPNNADDDNIATNNSKRPLMLVLILVGLIILTIPTTWYLFSKPTTTNGQSTTQLNHPPAPNADLSTLINNVFTKQSQWIDPTNDKFLLTRDARLSITHVWLDMQQTEQPILNIIIKIENRNKSTELSLQRKFAVQKATDQPHQLTPYVPLIRLATGDGHALDSETELRNRTIPMLGEISETYQIALTRKQTTELDQLRVAVPKAWFKKSGYWGFKIPQVMIALTKPTQTPAQTLPSLTSVMSENDIIEEIVDELTDTTKPPADGKGVLPPSPFGNDPPVVKPNGDQPSTLDELQSQINQQEKKRDSKPHGDALQK